MQVFDEKKFRAQIILKDKTYREVAKTLNISLATFHRRIAAQGNFTRKEIGILIEFLEIEKPMEIFFAKELA